MHGGWRKCPYATRSTNTPRVLLFGGINRVFVDGPVKDFFEQRGILAKTTEWSEFMCFIETENIVRLGFAQGHLAPAA